MVLLLCDNCYDKLNYTLQPEQPVRIMSSDLSFPAVISAPTID